MPFSDNPNVPRIFFTGVTAIHGWPVFSYLSKMFPPEQLYAIRPPKAHVPTASNIESCCITDVSRLEKIAATFRPTQVIHCSGVCDLDVCEERPVWAHRMNTFGTQCIVDVFGTYAHIVYLSTDLVFSGNHPPIGGYCETDSPDPVSVAGKTFLRAEHHIQQAPSWCIVRLGLPLGESVGHSAGAIDFIKSRFSRGLPLTLFHDEWRSTINISTIETPRARFLTLAIL
jgi:dTDP-4-dehydrorhamnose reductase